MKNIIQIRALSQKVLAVGRAFLEQFEQFALRGNHTVQIAIGVIIGNAFSKIITSFVRDIAMPPLSLILGFFTFTDLKITLLKALYDKQGHITRHAVELQIGSFLQSIIDFLIVAFCVFVAIKATNLLYFRLERKKLLPEALAADKDDQKIELLKEIRNLLLTQQQNK